MSHPASHPRSRQLICCVAVGGLALSLSGCSLDFDRFTFDGVTDEAGIGGAAGNDAGPGDGAAGAGGDAGMDAGVDSGLDGLDAGLLPDPDGSINSGIVPCDSDVCYCTQHAECSSGACDVDNGVCADVSEAVYALAVTGYYASQGGCGTHQRPCRSIQDAASGMDATKRFLVLLSTSQMFNAGAELPPIDGLHVVGNGVRIRGGSLTVTGGRAVLDGLDIAGATGTNSGAVHCREASVLVQKSLLAESTSGVRAEGCSVEIEQTVIERCTGYAVRTTCGGEACSRPDGTLRIERTRIQDNYGAIYTTSEAALIRNNLFIHNGADDQVPVLDLRGPDVTLTYNTLVSNFNNCNYTGIVACTGPHQGSSDHWLLSSNLSFDSFLGQNGCLNQIYRDCLSVDHTLAEALLPGTANREGDPLFSDIAAGDYTPGLGSPALGHGNPAHAPYVDYFGRARLDGAPDIGAIERSP